MSKLTIGSDLDEIFLGAGHGILEGPCDPGMPATYIYNNNCIQKLNHDPYI